MKTILIALLTLVSCGLPTSYVFYHGKWMTEAEYQRELAEEATITITIDSGPWESGK